MEYSSMIIGKKITNTNGKEYTVIAINERGAALLHGGYDYVVIPNLFEFEKNHYWSGGTYFPCFFDDRVSADVLAEAVYYLQNGKRREVKEIDIEE